MQQQMEHFHLARKLVKKPDEWAALMLTGYNFFKQGRLSEATRIFEGLVVLDAHNPYLQGMLGSIYQKQNEYELAMVRYNNAIALYPNDTYALANRGEILLKLGKFEEAAQDLKKAIELDTTKKDGAANRARLLVSIVKDAIEIAQRDGIAALQKESKTA